MSKKEYARYLAAKRRLASAQNKADRLTVKKAESWKDNDGPIKPNLIVNANGVAFQDMPDGVINCVTIDRKLNFKFGHFEAEASWREPSTKPPKGAFVISIK